MTNLLEQSGTLSNNVYTLNQNASKRWGAYEEPGSDSPEQRSYRQRMIRDLEDLSEEIGDIEVYADGEGVDAQDWVVTIIESSSYNDE